MASAVDPICAVAFPEKSSSLFDNAPFSFLVWSKTSLLIIDLNICWSLSFSKFIPTFLGSTPKAVTNPPTVSFKASIPSWPKPATSGLASNIERAWLIFEIVCCAFSDGVKYFFLTL